MSSSSPPRAPALPHGIASLSRLSGLSQEVIRAWERRYGALEPGRTASNRRRYGPEHVERLRLLVRLTEQGHSIGAVASLPTPQLALLLRSEAAPQAFQSPPPYGPLLDALAGFDLAEAQRILQRSALTLGLDSLLNQLIAPALVQIGELWARGRWTIAQEHAASSLIRAHLLSLLDSLAAPPGARLAVVATPEGELHDLGALLAAVAAAHSGWRVLFLGASVPAEELVRVAASTNASRLMLSIVAIEPASSLAQLAKIERLLPASVELVVGGHGAASLPPGDRFRPVDSLRFAPICA